MFELSLILAVLMILTALIPFSVRSPWVCLVPCLAWVAFWGFVNAVNNATSFVPAVGWLYLFLIVAFPIVRWKKLNGLRYLAICLACALVAYGIAMVEFIPAYREHRELLVQFPAVDLKPRLAYEQTAFIALPSISSSGIVPLASANASPKYDAKALSELDEAFRQYLDLGDMRLERRITDRRMAYQSLMLVHEGFVADFMAQPGVGRSRMPFVRLLRKSNFVDTAEGVCIDVPQELIDQPDLLAPNSGSSDSETSADSSPDSSFADAEFPSNLSVPTRLLGWLHVHNITNFVPLNSLGGVNDQRLARGFHAHAFHISPTRSGWEDRAGGWRLSRLELVSLLKHRPFAVYVSDHLPAMDELRDAPTRQLTSFETEAITRLIKGEDLVIEQARHRDLMMVGSIRAISDCRDCHQVPIGGLLGAFTYRLQRQAKIIAAERQ